MLHEAVLNRAASAPEAVAVATRREELTYGQLAERITRLSRRLLSAGIGPEQLVGVNMCRCPELVIATLGIVGAGGVYVPLDPAYPSPRLAEIYEDSAPSGVVRGPRATPLAELSGGRDPGNPVVVDINESSAPDTGSEAELPMLSTDNALYAMYTSGSTGKPKGVVNTHGSVVEMLRWMEYEFPLSGDSRVLVKTPFGFDVSVLEMFWPLLSGARLVLADPEGHQDPADLAETVEEQGVTDITFVPTQLPYFLRELDTFRGGSLRRVFTVGEDLPVELLRECRRRLPKAEVINAYGPTEAAVATLTHRCGPADTERSRVPIGAALGHTRARVLDPDTLDEVPRGERGELFLGGPQLARGYLNRPATTAERFLPDPRADPPGDRLYRTGDLARSRTDGAIEFLGRQDRQVKIHGNRLELGEVEAALRELRIVNDALADVRTDPSEGTPSLVAWISTDDADDSVAPLVRKLLLKRIPRHMIPGRIAVLEGFPELPNGKLDRSALPEPLPEHTEPVAAAEETSPHERAVLRVWEKVLRSDEFGPEDGFFEVGGNSMLLLKVRAELHTQGYTSITLLDLLENPTPRALGALLHHHVPEKES
ncbi:amino acid adenylation domain-containing protein [Actinopolyspora biskrensis]|uniref:Amino acid adenylation domain-containing protein n=1 Tax=Actinopolyspora biskrensis TaxID=1470178 RepID=A0A852Z763_9ACTN|nr:non-ribosomal peptide synthetase [Actinopolyspora biskrensis]NYH78307.1 amino acid adenylation domain-containing protein [Actinopolyspora biskrensis]